MLKRVNVIKAAACSLIAVFHTFIYLNANGVGSDTSFEFAAPGFHLFLLLSGFLLVYTARADETPLRFLVKRMTRLAPLYWLTTIAAIALVLWKPWILPQTELTFESIVKSFLFIPYEDGAGQIMPIVFSAWTLNYLVAFYLVFAASLLAPASFRIALLVIGPVAIMALAPLSPEPAARRFFASPLLLEFAAGALVGAALNRRQWYSGLKQTWVLALFVLGLAGMYATAFSDLGGVPEALAYCLTGSMTLLATAERDLGGPPFTHALLNRAGEASYGVLLIHPLIIPLLGAPMMARLEHGGVIAALLVVAVLVVSFVAAYFAHRYIQSPLISRLRGTAGRPDQAKRDDAVSLARSEN